VGGKRGENGIRMQRCIWILARAMKIVVIKLLKLGFQEKVRSFGAFGGRNFKLESF
jgi:hypothetical protein